MPYVSRGPENYLVHHYGGRWEMDIQPVQTNNRTKCVMAWFLLCCAVMWEEGCKL